MTNINNTAEIYAGLNFIKLDEKSENQLKGSILLTGFLAYDKVKNIFLTSFNLSNPKIANAKFPIYLEESLISDIFINENLEEVDYLNNILQNVSTQLYNIDNLQIVYLKNVNTSEIKRNVHIFQNTIINPNYMFIFEMDFVANIEQGNLKDFKLNIKRKADKKIKPIDSNHFDDFDLNELYNSDNYMKNLKSELSDEVENFLNVFIKLDNLK